MYIKKEKKLFRKKKREKGTPCEKCARVGIILVTTPTHTSLIFTTEYIKELHQHYNKSPHMAIKLEEEINDQHYRHIIISKRQITKKYINSNIEVFLCLDCKG